MDWKTVGDAVKTFAPDIALGLSGPVGWVSLATKYLGKALGGKELPTPQAALEAIHAMTPAESLALKAESDGFKVHMAELGVDLAKVDLEKDKVASADTQGARTNPAAAGLWACVIDAMVIASLATTVILIITKGMPENPAAATLLTTVVGMLGTALIQIIHFWRGSTKGSQDKSATIAALQGGDQ
jgi:hypothetical protein